MNRRWRRAAVAVLISGGLVGWLLSKIDLEEAARAFLQADPTWIAVAAGLSFAVLILRGIRFASLAQGSGVSLTIPAVAIQVFLNRVTPFRLGEISLPLLLRRHAGEDTASSLVGVFFVRLLDLAIVASAVALSLAFRMGTHGGSLAAAILTPLLLLFLLATFRRWLGALARFAVAVAARLGWTRSETVDKILMRLLAATADGRRLGRAGYAVVSLTSLGVFVAQTAMFACLLLAFGIHLPVLALARGGAVAQAGAALPIAAVGSFGTQEASWVAGFTWVGVPLDAAIITGVAAQLITLAFAAIFALPAWLWLERRPAPGARAPAATKTSET